MMKVVDPRVSVLTDPATLAAQLDQWGAERAWWPAGQCWRRDSGRIEHGGQPWAMLVYESCADETDLMLGQSQHLCMVEIFDTPPLYEVNTQFCTQHNALGWVRLSRFPNDRFLPTLQNVLLDCPQAHIVRYRPGRRCTFKARDPKTGELRFAKVFPDQRGELIHRDGEMLWNARAELGFQIAPPGRWEAEKLTLWQGQISGCPLRTTLYGPNGRPLAERMGRIAATLTSSSLQPPATFDGRTQLKRSARYARCLQEIYPALSTPVGELMDGLENIHEDFASTPLKPIHGALHVHQWLDDGTHLGLVDFDRLCLGDPENDAATFIAELDYENPAKVPISQLSEAFLSGYQAIAGPLNLRLLQAYRAHKHLSKALKAARALRTDGLQRAERNLCRALRHIELTAVP